MRGLLNLGHRVTVEDDLHSRPLAAQSGALPGAMGGGPPAATPVGTKKRNDTCAKVWLSPVITTIDG